MSTKHALTTLCLLLTFMFSCNEENNLVRTIPKDPNPGTTFPGSSGTGSGTVVTTINLKDFRANVNPFFTSINNYSLKNTDKYVGTIDDLAYLNYEKLTRDVTSLINKDFNLPNLNVEHFSAEVVANVNFQIQYNNETLALGSQYPSIKKYMSDTQLGFLDTYLNGLLRSTNNLNDATAHYDQISIKINNSTALNGEQKRMLFAMLEQVHVFMTSYYTGTWSEVYQDLYTVAGTDASSSGAPCIRVRDVLRAGIEGGVVGAVTGGYVGATAGTFAVPVLGTATGGVGGAVFGFAAGFVGGASANIGWQTFWSCLMKSPHGVPDTRCEDAAFFKRNPNYCLNNNSSDRKLWFELQ